MKRRDFIQKFAAASVYAQIPLWVKCSISGNNPVSEYLNQLPPYQPLTRTQAEICVIVQQILFPDTETTPGAIALQSFPFFIWVINDSWRDESENRYLISGLDTLNELAKEMFNKEYTALSIARQQEALAARIENGGENWASAMLSIIFESLFANPLYGGNPNETGWKWLHYVPGQPQPSTSNQYPDIIYKRKKENSAITHINQIIK